MAEKALVSMAQQFSGLPMDSLIGGPLNAAARANSAMGLQQTKFMLDTCFSQTDGKLKPIMIDMTLTRGVIDPERPDAIRSVDTTFRLPMLTIIPLNSLAVETVDINFEMEVKSSYGEEESQSSATSRAGEVSFEAKFGYGPFSASVQGTASYSQEDKKSSSSHYEKSNSAKYTVNVHAGQLPLPKGVNTIIEAYSKTIEPVMLPVDSPN